jgi:hypothetical protein
MSHYGIRSVIVACCWLFACIAKENPFTAEEENAPRGSDAHAAAAGQSCGNQLTDPRREAGSGGSLAAEQVGAGEAGAGGTKH